MDRKEKLEQITRMLNKDPKLPMERDEIRRALAMKRAQEDVIATMREKQRKIKNLQHQSDMGKLIRKEQGKTLRQLLQEEKELLERLLSNK
jgi:hypothetical protein